MVDKNKAKYYAHLNGIPYSSCAPVDNGDGPELIGPYAAAILAIPDNDPGFASWQVEQVQKTAISELSSTDDATVRIIEDIWNVLKSKGLVSDSDLPVAAKEKLDRRKELREIIAGN